MHKEAIKSLDHSKFEVNIMYVCKKYYIIYWKEYANLHISINCDASQYKQGQDTTHVSHKVNYFT